MVRNSDLCGGRVKVWWERGVGSVGWQTNAVFTLGGGTHRGQTTSVDFSTPRGAPPYTIAGMGARDRLGPSDRFSAYAPEDQV